MRDKKIIEKIMSTKGEVRGVVFKTDARFIKEREGEDGLKAVEDEMRRMGHPIDYARVVGMGKYSIGMRVLSLLAAKKALNWGDERIIEMGRCAPKYSFITKLMLRYFFSLESVAKRVRPYWRRHYSVGSMEGEVREDERRVVLRLMGIELHPILCKYLSGYYLGVTEMARRFKKLSIEEVKCVHRGDKHHEFIIRWED